MSPIAEDRIIYHYCSVDGFMNIMKNRNLWLTEASFTNDAWENQILDPVFERALAELVWDGEVAQDQMAQARDLYYHHSACFIFLGCFSSEGDLLPQWRSYADDGRGFAIGFAPSKMNFDTHSVHLNADFPNKYFLKEVIYMNEAHTERFMPLAKNWIRMRLTRGRHFTGPEIRRAIADDAAFSSLRYYCKNDSFQFERELRALWLPILLKDENGNMVKQNEKAYQQIRFRGERDQIISYTEMPFAADCIKRIVIGPKNEMKNHQDVLKIFLGASGYDDKNIEIGVSMSSYR